MSYSNDNFASAASISGASGAITPFHYDGIGDPATSEAGEDFIGAGETLWWTWTAPSSGTWSFTTSGSTSDDSSPDGLDTQIAVFSSFSTLLARNDDGTGVAFDYNSRVDFTATSGTTYWVQVDQYGTGQAGTLHLSWAVPAPPPAPPTVTGLYYVNAYNPADVRPISSNGTGVYATPTDYWVQVAGTNLSSVTSVAFTKTGHPDAPAAFNVLSPTLLEVKTPYTALANSYVRVTNPDGSATSARNVTARFAGPWRSHGTVTFDSDALAGDGYRYPDVTANTYGADGAVSIGPQTDGGGPALTTFTALVDTAPSPISSLAIEVSSTIRNARIDSSRTVSTEHDDVEWHVTQAGMHISFERMFYNRLADLGVPGYADPGLLPAGAVEAIPDGTDLAAAFFDSRLSTLTLTVTAHNNLPDNYQSYYSVSDSFGTHDSFDTSAPTQSSRSDVVEYRQVIPAGTGPAPAFQSTTALSAAPLLASLTIAPVVPVRIPASTELEPTAPIAGNAAEVTSTISAAGLLTGSRIAWAAALTSYRTYDAPADPGQAPIGAGGVQARYRTYGSAALLHDGLGDVDGVSEFRRHVKRTQATWDPPRYRYFYTTPQPLTPPALRQLQRGDTLAGGAPRQLQTGSSAVRQGPGRIR